MTRTPRIGVAVLGSTGSVGRQTLEVLAELSDRYSIVALAAGRNEPLLTEQARQFRPELVTLDDTLPAAPDLAPTVMTGPSGLMAAATHPAADLVVVATSGHAAITPTFAAIAAGKELVLANKETVVCAGELLMPHAAAHGITIRPADSEHSAIWQCLGNRPAGAIKRIHLTASGGPFRQSSSSEMASVTVADALAHPTWSMGGKITIDSASLMNKGLEVIEAHWLFGVDYDAIRVVVHPESIVHSLVEFVDGSQLAQCGVPSMKLPIQYALTWPDRFLSTVATLDLTAIGTLHFEPPALDRFPCLQLAYDAGRAGNTFPTVLSTADDLAVAAFVGGEIDFADIPRVISTCLDRHQPAGVISLESIADADRWTHLVAREAIEFLRR